MKEVHGVLNTAKKKTKSPKKERKNAGQKLYQNEQVLLVTFDLAIKLTKYNF